MSVYKFRTFEDWMAANPGRVDRLPWVTELLQEAFKAAREKKRSKK